MYYSALIGKPTAHSVSHVLFPMLAKAMGITLPYAHLKVDVNPEVLARTLTNFAELGFIGINVTLPYKLTVVPFLTKLDSSAIKVGAVNTVKFTSDQKFLGYNTDWFGLYQPIKLRLDEENRQAESVIIFGTGGAARAAIYAARELGAQKVYIMYRFGIDHNDAIRELHERQNEYNIELLPYEDLLDVIDTADIIINATSAGMKDYSSLTPFDTSAIDSVDLSGKIFMDAVFNPFNTPLLSYFSENKAYVIDGLWMMIYQAVLALEIWLDRQFQPSLEDLDAIHSALMKEVMDV